MQKNLELLSICSLFFFPICFVLGRSWFSIEILEDWTFVSQKQCHSESIEVVGISPNEEYVFSVAESLKVWDAKLHELLFEIPIRIKAASFTEDSNLIVANSYLQKSDSAALAQCYLIDIDKKSVVFEFPENDSPMTLPVVSRDKSLIVLSTLDGKISVWKWKEGNVTPIKEFDAGREFADYSAINLGVRNLGIFDDNSKIAIWYFTSHTGRVDWEIKLFDTYSGVELKSESELKKDSRDLEQLEKRASKVWALGLNKNSLRFMGSDDIGNFLFPYPSNGKDETWCRTGAMSKSGQFSVTGHESGQLILWRRGVKKD